MLSPSKIKEFIKSAVDLKLVTIKSMGDETCYVKKFTMGDTMVFRNLTETETVMAMVQIGVVDSTGKQIFVKSSDIELLSVDVVTELMELVSEHNSGLDVEDQAKKS